MPYSQTFPFPFDSITPIPSSESARLGGQRLEELRWLLANVFGIPDPATLNGAQHWLLQFADIFSDVVISGFLGTVPAPSLTMTTPTGVAYINGRRVVGPAAGYAFTYTASSDTYDDLSTIGALTHVAVANGGVEPGVTANSMRIQKVVTNGTEITTITDRRTTQITVNPTVLFAAALMTFQNLHATGTLTVDGATLLSAALHAVGTVLFDAGLTVTGAAALNGGLTVTGAGHITGAAQFDGATQFGSTVLLNADPTLALQAATKQFVENQIGGYKVLPITHDMATGSGAVSYTGVGFRPRAAVFFFSAGGLSSRTSWGFDDGATRLVVYDTYTVVNGSYNVQVTASIFLQETTGVYQTAIVNSFDADGFTLGWSVAGAPTAGTITGMCLLLR